jgi:hypothetical protein
MAPYAQPVVKLLTEKQTKLDKGKTKGVATFGIQMAPANDAGLGTMCASSGICADGCIAYTGMNGMPTHHDARVKRTILYRKFAQTFHDQLQAEIESWKRRNTAAGFALAARPNATTDQPLLGHAVATRNPDIQVYDYTKLPRPASRRLKNYHLTYSYSERTTAADIAHCVEHRVNIAVIMNVKKDQRLPKTLELFGRTFPVIDGDKTDLRFKDPSDQTYIVGLRWKVSKDSQAKLARAIAAGLVIDVNAAPGVVRKAA